MTLAITLLSRAATDADDARYLLAKLDLSRRPRSQRDAYELAMWRALAPLLAQHPGDRGALLQACPARWREAMLTALALPDWWHARCEPLPALVTQWAESGGLGWELPPRDPRPATPAVRVEMTEVGTPDRAEARLTMPSPSPLELWRKHFKRTGSWEEGAFIKAARLEANARDARRNGLPGHEQEYLQQLEALRNEAAAVRRREARAVLQREAVAQGRARDAA
jgi:hypothetical protein